MYAGQQVEEQPAERLFEQPRHPYTAALLEALPERASGKRLDTIPGVVPGHRRPAERLRLQSALRLRAASAAASSSRRWRPSSARAVRCHYPDRRRPPHEPCRRGASVRA